MALKKIFVIIVFSMISLLMMPASVYAGDDLRIAYPEFYPFFSRNSNGQMEGFFYEIITEAVEKRMGIDIIWTQMPWRRCQEVVKSGKFDAMITVPTKGRALYCKTHSNPFYMKEMKLFTYKGHKRLNDISNIKSIMDIKNGSFIVITYSGNGWHEKNIEGAGIKSYKTSEVHNVWKMLAAKRGDIVIEWPIGARAGIKKSGVSDKILETDTYIRAMPFHLLVSKKSDKKNILPRFNEVIKEMIEDGTIHSIVSVYY